MATFRSGKQFPEVTRGYDEVVRPDFVEMLPWTDPPTIEEMIQGHEDDLAFNSFVDTLREQNYDMTAAPWVS